MPITKIYKCCICHKVLKEKPHRLVHQEHEPHIGGYGRYVNRKNYDFCTRCFTVYMHWIRKHKVGVKNG